MDQLYVLTLDNDKWYIGRTANVECRFDQHKTGKGARWTQLHKPISIHETRELKSEEDEDKTTRDYMRIYGIRNVRGGKYCQCEFRDWNIKQIKQDMARDDTIKMMSKISNEFTNPDSELRSGRWFSNITKKFTPLISTVQSLLQKPNVKPHLKQTTQ